jgi:SAM-dependent methyltransferase
VGLIGGAPAYWFLKRFYPGGQGVPMPNYDPFKAKGISKLGTYFGAGIFAELRDKVVIDFGCGEGDNAIELAAQGCRRVIGLDIQEERLAVGRELAERMGLSHAVQFHAHTDVRADVILSTDAFEHFDDPAEILRIMRGLLRDDGYVLVEFGCTWYHPLGGHLFSVFPWAHLLFTEEALIRWRSDFKTDGATRFHEVAGGLNQMTIARWEKLVAASPFRFDEYTLLPIRAAKRWRLHHRFTRELFTSIIRARLVPR